MSSASRSQDHAQFERELQTQRYESLLENLRRQHLVYRPFEDWAGVMDFMHTGSSRDPLKNDILHAVFRAHQDDRDPRWWTVLLVIFWPALEAIHKRKTHWDPDPDNRWQNIFSVFLQVVSRIDVFRRPQRLVQKVVNDTFRGFYDLCRGELDWVNSLADPTPSEDEEEEEEDPFDALAKDGEATEFVEAERRCDEAFQIKKLRHYVSSGVISETDLFLIVGTRTYGASLSKFASDRELSYEWAKKTRQRAEARIRRLGWKQKKP